MRVRWWIVLGILILMPPLVARAQEEIKVSGRVVDTAGKPVAGAEVALIWMAADNEMKPYLGVTANAEGRFTLAVTFRSRKRRLTAMDKDRKLGGFAWVEEKSAGTPLEMKVAPLVRVHGRVFCKELNKRPPWINVFVGSDSSLLLRWSSNDASFSFLLPPDDYQLRTIAPECGVTFTTISLKPDKRDVDLETIDVPASIITRHIGKTPPAWHVTDARGVTKDVKLSDFKGKWVLLEFWGYW